MTTSEGNIPIQRFSRAVDSFDGDLELFLGLAVEIADRYDIAAQQMRDLARLNDLRGLQQVAHKLRSTWGLYAERDSDRALADRLEAAARSGDGETALRVADRLATRVAAAAADLRAVQAGA